MTPDSDSDKALLPPLLRVLAARLEDHGLLLRGAFHPEPDDGLAADVGTVALAGNAGPGMWRRFSAAHDPGDTPHALDGWTRRILAPLAEEMGAEVVYPFGGPPFHPFQRWAMKAEGLRPSPIGVLLHPEYGPWHAYRGAFLFAERLDLPPTLPQPHLCESCIEKPCLGGCRSMPSAPPATTGRAARRMWRPRASPAAIPGVRPATPALLASPMPPIRQPSTWLRSSAHNNIGQANSAGVSDHLESLALLYESQTSLWTP